MNHPSTPTYLAKSIFHNSRLIYGLAKRDIAGRYKGSIGGILWSAINPLIMLGIYTFVFSIVFKARWGSNSSDSRIGFAIALFAGLIVFNIFSEMASKSPNLIINNRNFVKKVIFPLEILPIVDMLTALFHATISTILLIVFSYLFAAPLPLASALAPLLILPIILFSLGFSWATASLGVYVRDVAQITSLLTTVLMFLTPIFYPISALPADFRIFLQFNPLAFSVESFRNAIVFGKPPNYIDLAIWLILSSIICWLGFSFFQKTRKGFADVI
jgi:lipopolysaccharide transport system permease protein